MQPVAWALSPFQLQETVRTNHGYTAHSGTSASPQEKNELKFWGCLPRRIALSTVPGVSLASFILCLYRTGPVFTWPHRPLTPHSHGPQSHKARVAHSPLADTGLYST